MRRVADEEQSSELHRIGDEASHRRDAALQDRSLIEPPIAVTASRVFSSDQILSSLQWSSVSSGGTWMYRRVISGDRMLWSANPLSWRAYTSS